MMIFGGYLICTTEVSLTYTSVEIGILIIGLYLCLTSDSLFFKDKKEEKPCGDNCKCDETEK